MVKNLNENVELLIIFYTLFIVCMVSWDHVPLRLIHVFCWFFSSINCAYYISVDFNILLDTPAGNGHKFMFLLDSCNHESVNQDTHLHGYVLTSFYSPVIRIKCGCKNCDFVCDHAVVKCCNDFPVQWAINQIKSYIRGTTDQPILPPIYFQRYLRQTCCKFCT